MLAFVLSGGGARGALQVGALRALLEANVRPELLVGTSVGAINAAHLALRGFTFPSLDELARSWNDTASANLVPSGLVALALCAIFARSARRVHERLRQFFIDHGLTPDISFGEVRDVRLLLVAADLYSGHPVLYGREPDESVLEGVIACTTLPPWMRPIEHNGRALADGGAISGMSIQSALNEGASEIVALDLDDPRGVPRHARGVLPDLTRLLATMQSHQIEMELALARARGVPVHRIKLMGATPVPIFDFRRSAELIELGYHLACKEIASWRQGHWSVRERQARKIMSPLSDRT